MSFAAPGYELYKVALAIGIAEIENEFNIYPNPTTDRIYLNEIKTTLFPNAVIPFG